MNWKRGWTAEGVLLPHKAALIDLGDGQEHYVTSAESLRDVVYNSAHDAYIGSNKYIEGFSLERLNR